MQNISEGGGEKHDRLDVGVLDEIIEGRITGDRAVALIYAYLHQGYKTKNISERVAAVRAGQGSHEISAESLGELKEHLYALAVNSIESVWSGTAKWIADHPSRMGRMNKPIKNGASILEPIDNRGVAALKDRARQDKNLRLVIESLRRNTRDPFVWHLKKWSSRMEQMSPDEDPVAYKNYKEYAAILKLGTKLNLPNPEVTTPYEDIYTGYITEIDFAWAIPEVIPAIFARDLPGVELTPDKAEAIARASRRSILSDQAKHHQYFLGPISRYLFIPGSNWLDPEKLKLEGTPERCRIIVDPAKLAKFIKERRLGEDLLRDLPRISCPALAARRHRSGPNVIEEVYDWFVSLANEYCFQEAPRLCQAVAAKRSKLGSK